MSDQLPVQKLQSAIHEHTSRSAYSSRAFDTQWQPLGDRILVLKDADPEKKGSIFIPENARKHTDDYLARGTVLKVGPGRYIEGTGRRVPMEVAPGDEIVFGRWTDWESLGERVVIIQEADIRLVTKFAPRKHGRTHKTSAS